MKRVVQIALALGLTGAASFAAWRTFAPDQTGVQEQRAGEGRGGRRGGRGRGGGDGPVAVLTTPTRHADVPVTLEAVGTAQALATVTVRPQVEGRLMEFAIREGQDVKRGDVIARIDPTIYKAQYDQAVARKAQNEANLANARLDLDRYARLAESNSGSAQKADTQRAAVAQLEAQVKADQGAIDSAKAYLDYTVVRAPSDGRTGIRLVDAGNLMRPDTTGLVVITQVKPITVLFNLPQQSLRAVNAASARGPVPVEALESDNRTSLDRGTLEVVDNQVDQTTGTVKVKAVFPNEALQLWPGSFVNVRLTLDTIRGAVVAPTASVQRGPNGAFVYTVADEKAVLRRVTVGRQTEAISVIESGLTPPERVVTTGFARLSAGETVRVADVAENEEAVAAAAANPAPRRRRMEGEARGPGGERSGPPRERRRGPEVAGSGAPGDVPTSSIGGSERPSPAVAGPQGGPTGAPQGEGASPSLPPAGAPGATPAPASRAGARPSP